LDSTEVETLTLQFLGKNIAVEIWQTSLTEEQLIKRHGLKAAGL